MQIVCYHSSAEAEKLDLTEREWSPGPSRRGCVTARKDGESQTRNTETPKQQEIDLVFHSTVGKP